MSDAIVIDLSGWTYRDSIELAKVQSQSVRIALMRTMLQNGSHDAGVTAELLKLASPESIEATFRTTCELFARVVAKIPASWKKGAADTVLDKPEFYETLSLAQIAAIQKAIVAAQNDAAGN